LAQQHHRVLSTVILWVKIWWASDYCFDLAQWTAVANAADSYPLHHDIACGGAIGKVDL
jgi:hypothetical protein